MTWTLVQTASWATPNTATNTPNATFSANVGSGNLVVGVVTWFTTGQTFSSILDNNSNSYTAYQTIADATAGVTTKGFFLTNITNAPNKVTVTFTGTANFCMLNIAEFSNTGGASPGTDPNSTGAGQNQTTGGTVTSTNITTTVNGDLVVGYCMNGSAATVPTVGSGYTTAGSSTGSMAVFAQMLEFQTQSTAGAIAATATVTGGDDTNTAVIAFKAGTSAAVSEGFVRRNVVGVPTKGPTRGLQALKAYPVPPSAVTFIGSAADRSRPRPIVIRQMDERRAFFRSPGSFLPTWRPTTGQEDRPANVRPDDSSIESPQFFRSPASVPPVWLPRLDADDRPKRVDIDPSGTAFVRFPVAATVPISGIAWYTPAEDHERLPQQPPDASLTAFSFKTPPVINTIAGMAWFNPPETRLPPVSGDPYVVQTLPWFIEAPLQQFYAQTNADDFNPLKAFTWGDGTSSVMVLRPPPTVQTPSILGWQRADVPITQFFFMLT